MPGPQSHWVLQGTPGFVLVLCVVRVLPAKPAAIPHAAMGHPYVLQHMPISCRLIIQQVQHVEQVLLSVLSRVHQMQLHAASLRLYLTAQDGLNVDERGWLRNTHLAKLTSQHFLNPIYRSHWASCLKDARWCSH